MKKVFVFFFVCLIVASAFGQTKISLRSTDKAECVKSDYTSLKATFSFSGLDSYETSTERGLFSTLSMPNTVIGGNEGDPQIPVVNELIAVPFGAQPRIEVTGYSTTDYRLDDYGIHTLVPRQPSLRKDQKPEEVPFVYNASAYQTRGFRSEPKAVVSVEGTMRGVQLGKMTIEPVSYDPVNNTLRVFNNIEVEVHFDGADPRATKDVLVETYSPYFNGVYKQLFNGRAVLDAYSDHPDLYTTPVKMLVITTSNYANDSTFQSWVAWKRQKGIYVDVYTTSQTGTTASAIKSFITNQYNQNHPTFLVIVGDSGDVTQSATGGQSRKNTDLYYSSPDGDIFPDMYTSRMPVSSTGELVNLLTKILQYEQYTMPNPSYLDETLLIAGWDSNWTSRVGKPTIQYANTYYYNSEHGITPHVFLTTGSGQRTCYNYINNVGFINYTAHGSETGWADPSFSVSNVNSLTNTDKYFWAMGNCCLAADWGYNGTCFAEAMLRAANKGAFGYIGSCPSTYWYEDYYFGVGATTVFSEMPTQAQTTDGVYESMFDDDEFNTLNSVPFFGNVAVTYAHAGGYQSSVNDQYYWEAYHTLGDGSVMPYHKNPSDNHVSHAQSLPIGTTSFAVNADAGSYVSITKDNEILGVAQVGPTGTVDVPITPVTSSGEVMIVVTRNQRKPYIQTIPAIVLDGPCVNLVGYTPDVALIGENTELGITFKNVGNIATSGNTTVTLTCANSNVNLLNPTKTFGSLAANATTTVSGFRFSFNSGIELGTPVTLHYTAVNGDNTWEGDLSITATQIFTVTAVSNNTRLGTVSGGGQFNYGESCTVTATPAVGCMFNNWTINGEVVAANEEYTFVVADNKDLVANFSEGVMVGGNGGTSTNENLPSHSNYNYTYSEQIYTSNELGGEGLITSIAFYNGGSEKTRSYDFYLKATTKSSFSDKNDWIAISASDMVFSGSVTLVANDWTTITLSTPFAYDGTSNVVLATDDNTGSYSEGMACSVFSTSSNQAMYVRSDNTNYDPMSPPTSLFTFFSSNVLLSVKNQIKLGITAPAQSITKEINACSENGGYYLIAVPFDDLNPEAVEHLFDNNYDLYAFNQVEGQEWHNYKSEAFHLEAGKGYLYANSESVTLNFTGVPYNGDGSVILHKTGDGETAGWNLVGNPFNEIAYIDRDFYVMSEDGSEIVPAGRDYIMPLEGIFVIANEEGEVLNFSTTDGRVRERKCKITHSEKPKIVK